ncbi:cytochrome c, partial [bacterium]|nr:cytochrome c [bacterium]
RRPWAVGTVVFGFTALVVLTIYGYKKPWSPDFGVKPLPASVVASSDPAIVHGAELVHQKGCLYCHDINGYGGHRGPGLSDIGQRLTQPELIIRINNGGYNMPSFAASLTAAELADMVAFLETRTGAAVEKNPSTSGSRVSK